MNCPNCDGEMNKFFDKQLKPRYRCFRCWKGQEVGR